MRQGAKKINFVTFRGKNADELKSRWHFDEPSRDVKRQHRPDEEVLSTKASAEAHRLLDMCRKNGIVKAAGAGAS